MNNYSKIAFPIPNKHETIIHQHNQNDFTGWRRDNNWFAPFNFCRHVTYFRECFVDAIHCQTNTVHKHRKTNSIRRTLFTSIIWLLTSDKHCSQTLSYPLLLFILRTVNSLTPSYYYVPSHYIVRPKSLPIIPYYLNSNVTSLYASQQRWKKNVARALDSAVLSDLLPEAPAGNKPIWAAAII